MAKRNVKRPKPGTVRIIAGEWRGRRISVPDADGLRPTPDRVRETLFNWLSPNIVGAVVLDAFAGSGALGLEALSRGAGHLSAVDSNRRVCDTLRTSIDSLSANDRATVHCADVLTWIATAERRFDVVFLDPPFALNLQTAALDALAQGSLVANAYVYVESDANVAANDYPSEYELTRHKQAAGVRYDLLRYCGDVD